MEELLNKLIEKGWFPFGVKVKSIRVGVYCTNYFFFEGWAEGKTLRELTSIESGLWQFVCENRLLKGPDATDDWQKNGDYTGHYDELFYASQYQYYLIESALCDEDKLEEFLLSNIVIKDE